jgi:hypothetical protein
MRYIFCLILTFFATIEQKAFANNDYSLVYVHIGPTLPKYLPTAITQARLFNISYKSVGCTHLI